jgi:hypothetical protein
MHLASRLRLSAERQRDAVAIGLLAVLPVLAFLPAMTGARLLGPGDGTALHFPLRFAVWSALARGEMPSWNPSVFLGSPLLASYRPGAFFPPMLALAWLPPFEAFQTLVVLSLSSACVLTFLYLRRLGAGALGAFVAGLCFGLGPYLIGHLDDTAAIVGAPTLPLLLLAAESHMRRASAARAAGLAVCLALLLLAGSPEVVRAGGALLLGRVLAGHVLRQSGAPRLLSSALALAAGVGLAAPQLVPTLLAAIRTGGPVIEAPGAPQPAIPGLTGLVLRYVAHTPAGALAVAAIPLVPSQPAVLVLGVALAVCLGLQWGRGPLSAPGALALVFDLALAVLAGLSLSAQWRARLEPAGARLRRYFLWASLAAAAALSVATATVGPMPQSLAAPVGILAIAFVLYFSLADSRDPLVAAIFLLPLTASFVMQPHGRRVAEDAPTKAHLFPGTPTKEAIDRRMGQRREEAILTLTRDWPSSEALDLAHANLGGLTGRRNVNGYDPMAPARIRAVLGGMTTAGMVPASFLRSDPARAEVLGVRWVQLPTSALTVAGGPDGLGDELDLEVVAGRPRFFPIPMAAATEIRVVSWLTNSVSVAQEAPVARVVARLASGREIALPLRAGIETAEWAYDRPDVQRSVAHARATVFESWPAGAFEGHHYVAVLTLPGRYLVDGLRVERDAGRGRVFISRLGAYDGNMRHATPVSLSAAYVSDTSRFREAAVTPTVRLFELRWSAGRARVVGNLRLEPDEGALLTALRAPTSSGFDLRHEALALATDGAGIALPPGPRSLSAEVQGSAGGELTVRAEGPGLLVLADSWDPGWQVSIDGRPGRVLRVNEVQMGVVLGDGLHRVVFQHRARGLGLGLAIAALAVTGLALAAAKEARPKSS